MAQTCITDGKLVGRVALSAGEGGLEALIEKLSRRAKELVDNLQAGSGSIAALASERVGDVVERRESFDLETVARTCWQVRADQRS